MNSHNSKAGFAFHKTPARSGFDKRDERIARVSLNNTQLAIADDTDAYTDPYNSTGKHVILQSKLLRNDE